MKYDNGLDFKPILEPHYEVIQEGGIYTICVYLNPDELSYCVDVSKLKMKIVKSEVFLEDDAAYIYLEGISNKVLQAISEKKSLLSICYQVGIPVASKYI